MQLAPQVIDYVVVHELAHLKVPDQSPSSWGEVRRVLPNYEAQRDWLRDKGGDL
jgi:predicted metal-dependent hydrolase